MPKILVIDDESGIRSTIKEILELEDYEVTCAEDGEAGFKIIKEEYFNLILCDIKMPKMNGVDCMLKSLEIYPNLTFIIMSGHGDIETAVDALKKGAFDYLEKPVDLNRMLTAIRNGLNREQLVKEKNTLKQKIREKNKMIGDSSLIKDIKNMILKVAPTEARIMLTGENGTGKEVAAQMIHENSARNNKQFIEVNCAAIPSELIESELFGHEKGAFTSAIKQRMGKFEQAHNGTLFLDEIGDMNLSAQAKVLRALQENYITRVGGDKQIKVDVRIISATNKNLVDEIKAGRFREDLFHRLNVIPIHIPSLKERQSDIPILIAYFISQISKEQGISPKVIEEKAVSELMKKQWTGNVRELRNVIERLLILSDRSITLSDIKLYT